jgi:hypothetical protein
MLWKALGGARRIAALVLASVLTAGLVAPAAAEPRPARRTAAVLDLKNLMTPAEYRAAGLDRLSDEEVARLNDWVGRMMLRLVSSRAPSSCTSPIASRIDGRFDGWSGDTAFALANGQVWRQRSRGQRAGGTWSPAVRIHRAGTGCVLRVEGIEGEIFVERVR